jgi:exodeoxyribonuclease-3
MGVKRIFSWNVNGLRACMNKGFMEFLKNSDADCVCLQETKMQPEQAAWDWDEYTAHWFSAERKGYSGTALLERIAPVMITTGFPQDYTDHPQEGRIITAEYPDFYLVCAYVPNAQEGLARLPYRLHFEEDLRRYLHVLDQTKPVIYCGDLNVAFQPIDLSHPEANRGHPGYSDEERAEMGKLQDSGFADVFRELYPDRKEAYTGWSYRMRARERNVGWRIDYFLVSRRFMDRIQDCVIHDEVMGADHWPIELILK